MSDEVRLQAGQCLLALSRTLPLTIEGLNGRMEPGTLDDAEKAEWHGIIADMAALGGRLAKLGMVMTFNKQKGKAD